MLSVLLNDVQLGKLEMADLVRLLAENPARLLGRFPEKGALRPGSDADLVLVDRQREVELRDERVKTKAGWSPYHGWRVRGAPVLTMLRGAVIARETEVLGQPGAGRYLEGRPLSWTKPTPSRSPGLALRQAGPLDSDG